jgi:hypothetical protein
MDSIGYDIAKVNEIFPQNDVLMAAQDAVVRLDERSKRSKFCHGWSQRILFGEALACQYAEGNLVHMEDLVTLDANVRHGKTHVDLLDTLFMLRSWRAALESDNPVGLLRGERPGLAAEPTLETSSILQRPIKLRGILVGAPIAKQPEIDTEKRDAWRRIWRETAGLCPLLAAAVVWDAWLSLVPEAGSGWRATLLAALVLKSRGVTSQFLLPIDCGWKASKYQRYEGQDVGMRLNGFLASATQAAVLAGTELSNLAVSQSGFVVKLKRRRKHSRLPVLVQLLCARPVVSVAMAAKALGCSHQAVEQMFSFLAPTARELTGRKRFRVWTAP